MTKDDLLGMFKQRTFAVLTAQQFHEAFPGRPLDPVELEFKIELAKAGGPHFNPRGSSHLDKLFNFCTQYQLSFRWVKDRVLFYRRGLIDVESIVKAIEAGQA